MYRGGTKGVVGTRSSLLTEWGGGFLYKVPYNICSLDF